MTIQEKRAWFTLIVISVVAVVYAILYAITKSPIVSEASFAFIALLAAEGRIGRNEQRSGRVVADERDIEINRKATVAAYSVFWVCFVAAAMAPFFILGPNASICIKATDITYVIWPAFSIVLLVRSLVMITLYRKSQHA